MASITLPLSITLEEMSNRSIQVREKLRKAWNLECTDDVRTRTFGEICEFTKRLDPYDRTVLNKLEPDFELFQAHIAHAFRLSRSVMFKTIPDKLASLGGKYTAVELDKAVEWFGHQSERPVKDAMGTATSEKEAGNQLVGSQNYVEAVWTYLYGLAALHPWSSDATIMSYDQAGEIGLRQIEQGLLLNIAISAHKALSVKKVRQPKAWVYIFELAITALEYHPFATWGNVVKRLRLQAELVKKYRAHFSLESLRTFDRRIGCLEAWSKMPEEGWAHEACGQGHRCYLMGQ